MIKLNPIITPLQFEHADQVANWKMTFALHGGLDVETGAFIPLKKVKKMLKDSGDLAVNFVMDAIAGAAEFGSIELNEYADFEALFAQPKEIPDFLEAMVEYGESFHLNDRHFNAFFNQLVFDEMDCTTYQTLAGWLEDNAE